MSQDFSDVIKKYNHWTSRATSEASKVNDYRLNCEEFYFSDVEDTLSQFTMKQKRNIDTTFNIPVSTKISYAIIEQLLAFLTGSKPFPRLVSTTESTAEWTQSLEQGYHGLWYESKANRELKNAIRDALVSGSGFLFVRKNNHYNETTFNTVIEYKSWKNIYIDPDSVKEDFEDAEYVIFMDVLPKYKAEKTYDININEDDYYLIPEGISFTAGTSLTKVAPLGWDGKQTKYVLVREIFHKEEINIYVSDEGHISTKKPKPIELPNEEKAKLMDQVKVGQDTAQEGIAIQAEEMKNTPDPDELRAYDTEAKMLETEANITRNNPLSTGTKELNAQTAQMNQQLLMDASQMPDTIPGFEMILQDGSKVQVKSINKIKKKRIKRVLLVGNKKIEEEYLPISTYPIIHITFCHNNSPNKTYGLVHFIKDLVKAMNKFLALLIFDMQSNGQRKVLAPKGSIVEPKQFESGWANPGSLNFWNPNPALPDAGRPIVVDPSPLNQGINSLMQYFLTIVEYVTGINSLMQGSPTDAPQTMGGVQSLQAFGSQRIKSFARSLETSLEGLALVAVGYLQNYAPRDEWIKFFDDGGTEQSVKFLDMPDDLQFKVRVDVVNSLPTQKQLLATLLSSVSGQTKNPLVADALTKVMLKLVENPEASKLADEIDVMKQMEGQINSLTEENKKEKNKVEMLENQLFNKELSYRIALEFEKARGDINTSKEKEKAAVAQDLAGSVETGPIHSADIEADLQNMSPVEGMDSEQSLG